MINTFGGPMTIQEFREGSLTIDSIEWVNRCFESKSHPTNNMYMNARIRDFKYDFYLYPQYHTSKEEQKQEETVDEPTILMANIDESFFY